MLFSKKNQMGVVEQALKRMGWRYIRVDDDAILTGVGLPSGYHTLILIRNDEARRTMLFLFNLSSSTDIDQMMRGMLSGHPPIMMVHPARGHTEEQVAEVCELLMYWNYRIILGNFERDQSDGEIRFRIAFPYRDSTLTVDQVIWCVSIGCSILNEAVPEIEKVIGGVSGGMVV